MRRLLLNMNDMNTPTAASPLGKQIDAPQKRDSSILQRIERHEPGIEQGVDVWTCWEAYWLDDSGRAQTAVLQFEIDAQCGYIVESKSVKLYLQGLNHVCFASDQAYLQAVTEDLGNCLQYPIKAELIPPLAIQRAEVPGINIDSCTYTYNGNAVDNTVLCKTEGQASLALYNSNLFRSLCPVTNQPDYATVIIAMVGTILEPESVLAYLRSFHSHGAFHEQCCTRVFRDIKQGFAMQRLSVVMAFSRRGGIDITPMRWQDGQPKPEVGHLWRQ